MLKFDDPTTWPATWRERCELIANTLTFRNGAKPTAKEIFESSPTGELFQVHDWFIQAAIKAEINARAEAGESREAVYAELVERWNSREPVL